MQLGNFIILAVEIVMVVFQLRSLIQSSHADYSGVISQTVYKMTDPVMKLLPFRNKHFHGVFYAGFLLSLILAAAFWLIVIGIFSLVNVGFSWIILLTLLMTVKCFGYLIMILLFVQALTSWLPSTRTYSMEIYRITYPLVAPIQKIIPPIGMIDLSLMVALLVLYFINSLFYSWFNIAWAIL